MMRKSAQVLTLAVLALLAACGAPAQQPSQPKGNPFSFRYDWRYERITSFDGTQLAANIYTPKAEYFAGKRPTLVMPTSWAADEWQYDYKGRELADDGFQVVVYAPRGFGSSDGLVDVAGPKSVKDISVVLDWTVANTSADVNSIAMVGISYGGGLGLLGAAHDPRVKAVVSISGWADLRDALYARETVREFWIDIIIGSGILTGRLDPEVFENVDRLKNNQEIASVMDWGAHRSAATVVDKLNARQVPVFLANSYEDNLFPPAQARPFFDQLTGPKKFYLDHGIHSTSALPGLIGLPSSVWVEARRWLDQWLKGIDTGIKSEQPITFQTPLGQSLYSSFPPFGESQQSLKLEPVNQLSKSGEGSAQSHPVIKIIAGIDSGASSGVPILTDVGSGVFQMPLVMPFDLINQHFAAVYKTTPLQQGGLLRGAARVHVPLEPHGGPMQLVAYLYHVSPFGIATMISYGVSSTHVGASEVTNVDIDLGIAAADIPNGDLVAIAIDTVDPLYLGVRPLPYELAISHTTTRKVTFDLPFTSNLAN